MGEFSEITIINNDEEMAKLAKAAKNAGFQMPVHPEWADSIKDARSDRFIQAKEVLSQHDFNTAKAEAARFINFDPATRV